MSFSLDLLPALAATFILVFARVGTLVMLMPGFGERTFPARLRLSLALILAALMSPLVRDAFPSVLPLNDVPALLLLLGGEVLTGLFIGMSVRLVTGTMASAGTFIAQQAGLGFVTQVDPTQGSQSVLVANFLTVFGITLVFAMDLHHLAIAAMHDSYRLIPPGGAPMVDDALRMALMIFAGSFALAVQISAPFLVIGIVFQVALGVLSRLMPQLQILFLAMPIQIAAAFLLLAALMGTIANWYGSHVAEVLGRFIAR
jgi:flagellar biosynthetic protein FliR